MTRNHPTLPGARVRKFEHPQELADARNGEKSPKTVAGRANSIQYPVAPVNGVIEKNYAGEEMMDEKRSGGGIGRNVVDDTKQ